MDCSIFVKFGTEFDLVQLGIHLPLTVECCCYCYCFVTDIQEQGVEGQGQSLM